MCVNGPCLGLLERMWFTVVRYVQLRITPPGLATAGGPVTALTSPPAASGRRSRPLSRTGLLAELPRRFSNNSFPPTFPFPSFE